MARPQRLLACIALLACLCALLPSSGMIAKVPRPEPSAQERLAHGLSGLVFHTVMVGYSLLPGLAVSLGLYSLYAQRDRLSTKARWGMALLLLVAAAALLSGRSAISSAPGAEQRLAQGGSAEGERELTVQPHSGEEVLMSDGSFVRLADPTKTDGSPVTEDWRQNLASALVQAIAQGQEQVVIMFTRQGCPWCDRQLPVLQEAIRRRSGVAAGASAAAASVAFVGGAGAGSFLNAPLRVFILDAEEFPHLIQQFGVEAFPTSLVFGRPRVTPFMGRGYLDQETFEQVCREAALAEPEPEEGSAPRGRGKGKGGRRGPFGLFR
uniref:Thioredoxin domain-containing protein n=1 Tax=Alexandrium monilatum TaxID=311494 RepID=A0A7S4PW35_9DINO|mmetsp:Transcript_90672/g.270610  ORF Transcript_90672/g.270610 Transcript_90672/m.270610 type:complete len:323 (-) Transcript_90672:99-1067(-)